MWFWLVDAPWRGEQHSGALHKLPCRNKVQTLCVPVLLVGPLIQQGDMMVYDQSGTWATQLCFQAGRKRFTILSDVHIVFLTDCGSFTQHTGPGVSEMD